MTHVLMRGGEFGHSEREDMEGHSGEMTVWQQRLEGHIHKPRNIKDC